ncbi:substrate-binding domain-containing protein [Streptomyces sp. 35G-GA-8]|uniref:substrate-binding domain-containing protein n=1 Tax=Streptomyces sp. 35G-GA-8 TaxID=2939434 RepID=UPI00201E917E|nr:substrate-binding domain-containing protein [Streptomyces sp. 35G-GA-8]MCL7376529.1 substrate-binding and VWA domain-containing protein [Streptomyces sp. 35G-GA-8]
MGRHSLPDAKATGTGRVRSPRRRTVSIATALVLAVAAGTGVAAQSGLLSFADACADAPVRLDLAASPDIAPALRAIAERARQDRVTTDGHCLDVRVEARENHQVAAALADGSGTSGYQVWVPDSGIWVERAKGQGDGTSLTPAGTVATSPVTLATVPTTARTLGWPRKSYTWAELAAAATTTGADGLPLGAADPARSATGLLALSSIAESSRRAGAEGDTRTAATAEFLTQRVSDTDTQVLETLARDDSGAEKGRPRRNEAVLLSEQAAFTHNSKGSGSANLNLFYPTDGAPVLDYPYSLVDETELTTDQSRAAMRFMALLGDEAAYRTLQKHGFRVADTALDPGVLRTAGALSPQPYDGNDALPPSSESRQWALGLWTVTVRSARLTTVVDTSGSMAAPVPGRDGQNRMDVTKASLLRALAGFTPEDEIGLWEFATRLDGAKDYRELESTARLGEPVKGGGTHRDRLSDAVTALKPVPDGDTGLYDTMLAAYREAVATYVSGKFNALVILTDGSNKDDDSISRAELIKRLKTVVDPRRPVPLIAIAVGPDADRNEVDTIARATGGAGYEVSDPAEIRTVMLRAVMLSAGLTGPDSPAADRS